MYHTQVHITHTLEWNVYDSFRGGGTLISIENKEETPKPQTILFNAQKKNVHWIEDQSNWYHIRLMFVPKFILFYLPNDKAIKYIHTQGLIS